MQGQSNILEWIRKGLEKPGLSQAGLAEALGIDRAQVTRLLQGKRELKVRELKLVGDYLGSPAPAVAANDVSEGAPAHDVATSVTEAIEAMARGAP